MSDLWNESFIGAEILPSLRFRFGEGRTVDRDQKSVDADRTTEAIGGLSGDRLRKMEKWALRAFVGLGSALGGLFL